jgi:hypothetical protein
LIDLLRSTSKKEPISGSFFISEKTVPIGIHAICVDRAVVANDQIAATKERPKQTPN